MLHVLQIVFSNLVYTKAQLPFKCTLETQPDLEEFQVLQSIFNSCTTHFADYLVCSLPTTSTEKPKMLVPSKDLML